jgi:hypothetical protein
MIITNSISGIILEKLIVAQEVKSPIESEFQLQCSQEPAIGPYLEPVLTSTQFLCKIYFGFISPIYAYKSEVIFPFGLKI